MKKKLFFAFGTRPEAIKMAPVIMQSLAQPEIDTVVCLTAQHRAMLDQVINIFNVPYQYDLNLMVENQTLADLTAKILTEITPVLVKEKPDLVLVQGDTTTAFASALAAFYQKIPVAHIEAGLRTGNIYEPFPEEINRCLTRPLSSLHFCPTSVSKLNLLKEHTPENSCFVTGNTVIDALNIISQKLDNNNLLAQKCQETLPLIDKSKKLILVTGHRRENFGDAFINIFEALKEIAKRDDVQIIYPVHLNPNVRDKAFAMLQNNHNIMLINPVDYVQMIWLMKQCYLIITDSGGIQEEAPTLSKPVLVTRNVTERAEAVTAGTAKLVGSDKTQILNETFTLLDNNEAYYPVAKTNNPFGNGDAASQIITIIKNYLQV